MKKLSYFSFLIIGVMLITSFVQYKDPKATKILDETSAKFKALKSFRAEYTLLMENPEAKIKETYKGEAVIKGNKFKIITSDQELYNNGETVWTYFKEDSELTITPYDEADDFMNVDKLVNMYRNGYKYLLKADETINGDACYVIDLEPDLTPEEQKTNTVFKIRLYLDKTSHVIKRWKIFERTGNRFTYTIENFKPNVDVSDSEFSFDRSKHPELSDDDIVDMR